MSSDPTRMCEILVGLGDVNVLSVEEDGTAVTVTIETRATVAGCPSCGVVASSKGRRLSPASCDACIARLMWTRTPLRTSSSPTRRAEPLRLDWTRSRAPLAISSSISSSIAAKPRRRQPDSSSARMARKSMPGKPVRSLKGLLGAPLAYGLLTYLKA